jgi:hypothetical protein
MEHGTVWQLEEQEQLLWLQILQVLSVEHRAVEVVEEELEAQQIEPEVTGQKA